MPPHPDASLRIRYQDDARHATRIKVVGVGGGGNNAVNQMIDSGLEGVDFISMNTDLQSLRNSRGQLQLQLGARLTGGLGTGANPEVGRRAALEDSGKIIEALEGADMVFVTAGLGGGMGTGAAPVIASLASQMGALTVAIVTRPFGFEGKRRMNQAERGVQELLEYADTLIVIPNDKLLEAAKNIGFFDSFLIADDVLRQAVQSITDIITVSGVINRDFADVRTTLAGMGYAVMGTATRKGPNRATEAAMAAMNSPLLEAGAIDGARGILINITGSSSLKLSEVSEASTIIQSAAHEDATIIFGAILDERLDAEVKVTVIAAGFCEDSRDRAELRLQSLSRAEQPAAYSEEPAPHPSFSLIATDVLETPRAQVIESQQSGQTSAETFAAESGAVQEQMDGRSANAGIIRNEGETLPASRVSANATQHLENGTADLVEETTLKFLDDSFEDDLLASIEGPAFDFTITSVETEYDPQEQPSAQPEMAKLRQNAIAAYMAIDANVGEGKSPSRSGTASFADILADRENALNLDLPRLNSLQPLADVVAPRSQQSELEPRENELTASQGEADATRFGVSREDAELDPISAPGLFSTPLFRSSASLFAKLKDDSLLAISAESDASADKNLDEPRSLKNQASVSSRTVLPAGPRPRDLSSSESGELDIPAFLRRRT